ncbi:6065_t:CDS:2, partial [Entrophospora sp. SA101]
MVLTASEHLRKKATMLMEENDFVVFTVYWSQKTNILPTLSSIALKYIWLPIS